MEQMNLREKIYVSASTLLQREMFALSCTTRCNSLDQGLMSGKSERMPLIGMFVIELEFKVLTRTNS